MDSHNVTFACDDETSFEHTKVFLNKNLVQCYHNNRGYCSFRDRCRYNHFNEICTKTYAEKKNAEKDTQLYADTKMIVSSLKQKMCI